MIWFLTFLMWSGDGFTVYRIPTTSATACSDARVGVKFAPSASSAATVSGAGLVSSGGALVVYCVQEASTSPVTMQFPTAEVPVP